MEASPAQMAGQSLGESCLVPGCSTADLTQLSRYHQRHRVCQVHLKAPRVKLDGSEYRFCQQCGKFQPLSDFKDDRRSCKAALRAHNARRRHSSMASDGALYTGRFRSQSSSKRSLLGKGGSGSRRHLDRSTSLSSTSQNSAPALLQPSSDSGTNAADDHTRLQSDSIDWPANSNGACTVEQQDPGLSVSPSASFASVTAAAAAAAAAASAAPSAAAEEAPQQQPARRKGRPRAAQQQRRQQKPLLKHQAAQAQVLHLSYIAQHSSQGWQQGCNPALAQLDALQLLQSSQQKAAALDGSAATQAQTGHQMLAGHMQGMQGDQGGSAGYLGRARCRLGLQSTDAVGCEGPLAASTEAYPAATSATAGAMAGWRGGFSCPASAQQQQPAACATQGFAASSMGWTQGWDAYAGHRQQQHLLQQQQPISTQGLSAVVSAGAPAPWQQQQQSCGSTGPGFHTAWQQQESSAMQCSVSTQGLPAAGSMVPIESWLQDSSPPVSMQQPVSTQGCPAPAGGMLPPAWQAADSSSPPDTQQQQQQQPSSTESFYAAAQVLSSRQQQQQPATQGMQATTAFPPNWTSLQPHSSAQHGVHASTAGSQGCMPVLQAPAVAYNAPAGAHAAGQAFGAAGSLWHCTTGQGVLPLLQAHAAPLQQATIGQVGWPAAAPQPSFPQPFPGSAPQLQAPVTSAPGQQHMTQPQPLPQPQPQQQAWAAPAAGAPTASATYIQQQAGGLGMHQLHRLPPGALPALVQGLLAAAQPAASAQPHASAPQAALHCSSGQQVPGAVLLKQEPMEGVVTGGGRGLEQAAADWLDVLACSEDGVDDGPGLCSPCDPAAAGGGGGGVGAAQQAGSALSSSPGDASASATPQKPSGLAFRQPASPGAPAQGAGAGVGGGCVSPEPFGMFDCFEDYEAGDLPSEEVDALLDQALDDLFKVQPQGVVAMCCVGAATQAAGSGAGSPAAEAAHPCSSSAAGQA